MASIYRREFVKFSFGISFFTALATGCSPQIVTISNIIVAARTVKHLLRISRQMSRNNVYALNVSYKELGAFLNEKKFTTNIVQNMEQRSFYLTQSNNNLRSKISETNSSANELFSLLYARANQNSTPDLKNKMNSDIHEKQKLFKEKMKIAEEVLSNIEKSSKKYDDILGYIQVASGLAQIDQYIRDVGNVIVEARSLDLEIQNALRENESIVSSFG